MKEYTAEQPIRSRRLVNLVRSIKPEQSSYLCSSCPPPLALGLAAGVIATGTLGWLFPMSLAMTSVFIFAGPHNLVELHYFLSRLPCRPGRWLQFFITAISGLAILAGSFIVLSYTARVAPWQGDTSTLMQWCLYACWHSALVLWIAALLFLAGRASNEECHSIPAIKELLLFAWVAPSLFGLCLVYAHPLIGLWLFDRELAKRYKGFRKTYHWCLLLAAAIFILIWCLPTVAGVAAENSLHQKILSHAGASTLPWLSSTRLLSSHVFLEMLHYSVWLVGIPIVALRSRAHNRLVSLPLTHLSEAWKKLIALLMGCSFLAMLGLWFSFAIDYETTRDIYFSLAIVHVLAEFPFLIRSQFLARSKKGS